MPNRIDAPKVKSINEIKYQKPNLKYLDNGIKLYTFESDNSSVIKLDLVFRAGVESQNKPLQSLFANAMIKEGPVGISPDEVSELFDYYGSYVETFTGASHSGIRLFVPVKYVNDVLPVFANMIKNPSVPRKEFDIMKQKFAQTIKNSLKKTNYVAMRGLNLAIFGAKHPLGYFLQAEDVEKLKFETIQSFIEEKYKAKNCHIMLSGQIDSDTIKEIDAFFGDVNESGNWNAKVKVDTVNNSLVSSNESLKIYDFKDAVQSSIYAGLNFGKLSNAELIDLGILNTIFGGYFGSRLMKNIREDKGYTYGIGSFIIDYSDAAILKITSDVGVDVTKNTIDEIIKEMQLLKDELVSVDELNLVKNYMLGELLGSFDGVFKTSMVWEGIINKSWPTSYIESNIDRIKSINPEEIQVCAKKYFNIDNMQMVVAGKIEN